MKYLPLLTLRLQGIYMESISHGIKWFHCSSGISQAVLLPVGQCSCAHPETPEGVLPTEYLKAGIISMAHKSDSLFDSQAAENNGQNRTYNTSWDQHTATVTEASLLERTPAFASDFLYQLEIPDDISSERLSELGSDFEYSDFRERSLLRLVVGPLRIRMCSGLFHRFSSLRVAASAYDYPPYSVPKPDPTLSDLPPPCAEDFDALQENIPTRSMQITIIAPAIEFQLLDHPYFQATKRNLYRKRKVRI
ncbi:hypothetical protein ILUMI_07040 [Ignelater luminosus]|uniref:Uncharacterized protein n=1 Tax=Ignelater luminosus TaxID=2038154 RepID=A0A8K0GH74_IGNLU|nr:hypothetical protein ILUMI_07040 [Ignelater luminosus]